MLRQESQCFRSLDSYLNRNLSSGPNMTRKLTFIDLFAGCGGLSLGLVKSGWNGLFAIEKSESAFSTFEKNLINNDKGFFSWPTWLPQKAQTCEDLLKDYSVQVSQLRGHVDLIVGGPPCQGFSTAGKRNPADPRNKMSEQYLAVVGLVMPKYIVIENVAGFNIGFGGAEGDALLVDGNKQKSYAAYIAHRLTELGYSVSAGLLNCADFGVPQNRKRFFLICERQDDKTNFQNLFSEFLKTRSSYLVNKNLPVDRNVSSHDALYDLETYGKKLVSSTDSPIKGFQELNYWTRRELSPYLKLMRGDCEELKPNSLRLAKHKAKTIEHFKKIREVCRAGVSISLDEMKKVGTKKHSITVLKKSLPSPTVTTLPDDILHYSEPRILTVRENARLQSFPDWFEFLGPYTTGGARRKLECPRYTQVGNAVPPLVSEAIGTFLKKALLNHKVERSEKVNLELI
ncbi:DNA cytosine methyltransferase [Undibacterium fentianense]|uniref:Cytosine-specific methyltransferase n=1 Tax=Undibacterium fentianense TaxID=2828728 RepID=A0A941E323_9BURK|nr:DNA cytosine methyltransferase [Undibacterium fentianense]MBR7801445.1 DNA cytosine methyltransferase [Undibacterium fentianense]